jgi:4-carboxymuconolactone decarboxylase
MSSHMTSPNETLQVLSEGDLSVMDTLLRMAEGSLEASGLDPQEFMLVRVAALATLDAAPCAGYVRRVTHDEIADAVG